MIVYKLTLEEKILLDNNYYIDGVYFNPTLDANGNWFISEIEVNFCEYLEFDWVKNLPQIEHLPIIID